MTMVLSQEEFQFLVLKLAGYTDKTIKSTTNATKDVQMRDFCYTGTKTLCDLYKGDI